MKTKKEGFLSSYLEDFKIGDIVSWKEFKQDKNYDFFSFKNYGAIIKFEMTSNTYSERFVWVAIVLPFGQTKTKQINLNLLKKETI